MKAVKVYVKATGVVGVDNHYAEDSFETDINGTDEEIMNYYRVGRVFNMGTWYDADGNEHEDDMMMVTKAEIL